VRSAEAQHSDTMSDTQLTTIAKLDERLQALKERL
jgi:hypothetical protein